ncbi:phosphomevalonate kinase [Secundilactobacillus similis DSM 23365 = JCM 2765]|jgi:phosphomevalonate kinase|uniref:phosphomevalonate kinase n=1 Tax=Secundilactobacillus similis DSM 23365 = JCM 2765 TaxID=1423804 RepID=A0A0R2EJ80_9LACO|nr:phosphomevalonate kinase [Secundilactobacillus similis DSM 23365 = JCM 2765]
MKGHDVLISVKAPGKLYIAGEYAVVEAGFPAIIVALDQFVTVSIQAADQIGSIVSSQYQENSIYWRREDGEMVFDNRDNPFHYILSAIKVTEDYAKTLEKPLGIYHLTVESDLDSHDGRKYGLGSSAAVTVATIKALCKFYDLPVDHDKLFKLAAIAHFTVQGNGSLGDIAASVYGGWIAYHSFDREWLKLAQKNYAFDTLLDMDWPGLNVELLTPPAGLKLLVGWTGSPASTSHLVDRVALNKAKQQGDYQRFLENSKACLKRMINGFREQNLKAIQAEINVNRDLLNQLDQFTHAHIETPLLQKLCDIAQTFGGVAKTSGAGGGDCGIAIIDQKNDISKLLASWQAHQIIPLNFNVHHVEE